MKKSLERMKVRLDQNLNRTEKSVALTPELLKIEETIGVYRQACQTLQKKFSEGLQGFGKGTDGSAVERRLKKTGDFMLGQTLSEVGRTLTKQAPNTCLGQVLLEMGGVWVSVGYNQVNFDISVEQLIVGKLQDVLTVELPAILAGRKQLDKLVLDLDTAKNRLEKAREEEQHGAQGPPSRIERLIEDLDDINRKVDQTRDGLAADMMFFLAKDGELATLLTQFLEHKLQLHSESAQQLESGRPRLESVLATRRGFPIFGTGLTDHLEAFSISSGIAFPIQLCITRLVELGLDEEGLFRLAAGSSKVRRLRAEIEAGQASLSSLEGCDHHVLTTTIKSYLRELPSPLLGADLYSDWLEAGQLQGEDRFDAIWNLLQSEHLPRENYRNIQYIFKFLNEVTKYAELNKMTASNLAIVITPNVIWETEAVHDPMDISSGNILAQVVELIISQHDWFFQNDQPIPWAHQLTQLGNCLVLSSDDALSSAMTGIAGTAHLPLSLTSSPLPVSRDKKSKHKKAPAPPGTPGHSPATPSSSSSHHHSPATPSSSSSSSHQPVGEPLPSPPSTPSLLAYSASTASRGGGGANKTQHLLHHATAQPSSNHNNHNNPTSPVSLRKGSPGVLRSSCERSKSVEGQQRSQALQHPSQPPPKPPINGGRNSTPPTCEFTEPPTSAPPTVMATPTLYPDLSKAEAHLVGAAAWQQQQQQIHSSSSSSVSSQEEGGAADRSSYPVPAPRLSKPALPSKPEGLSRNMSMSRGETTTTTTTPHHTPRQIKESGAGAPAKESTHL